MDPNPLWQRPIAPQPAASQASPPQVSAEALHSLYSQLPHFSQAFPQPVPHHSPYAQFPASTAEAPRAPLPPNVQLNPVTAGIYAPVREVVYEPPVVHTNSVSGGNGLSGGVCWRSLLAFFSSGQPAAAIVVFVAGCFLCPLWLAGCFFVLKTENRLTQVFGALSIMMCCLSVLAAIAAGLMGQ
eukprot:TRINITY_DN92995_c0_g1_i1.p1 TRINITY_DN92995_c0_g1~~TRINITY_DN92995_c0_g1_i1.p1  ORF type:complete len:184 (+),score=12.72 TRINITY_DN92995_c0_g1_i1:49-600(+)